MKRAETKAKPQARRRRLDRLVRFPILAFAAILELALAFVAWGCAAFSLRTAERIMEFAEKLPDLEWYFGKESNK